MTILTFEPLRLSTADNKKKKHEKIIYIFYHCIFALTHALAFTHACDRGLEIANETHTNTFFVICMFITGRQRIHCLECSVLIVCFSRMMFFLCMTNIDIEKCYVYFMQIVTFNIF